MSELPQPDVMDRAGRARRIVLAFVVGVVVAGATYTIAYLAIPKSEMDEPFVYVSRNMSASSFVYWLTAVAGSLAFLITLGVASALAKRRWQRERGVASAQVIPK